MATVTIHSVTHDLVRKRSIVFLVWDTDPERRLGLPVAFGCTLENVHAEAAKALRELTAETAALTINPVS